MMRGYYKTSVGQQSDKFLEKYNLPTVTQEKIVNLTGSKSIKEIESQDKIFLRGDVKPR